MGNLIAQLINRLWEDAEHVCTPEEIAIFRTHAPSMDDKVNELEDRMEPAPPVVTRYVVLQSIRGSDWTALATFELNQLKLAKKFIRDETIRTNTLNKLVGIFS